MQWSDFNVGGPTFTEVWFLLFTGVSHDRVILKEQCLLFDDNTITAI